MVKPKKSLGQHFLTDQTVRQTIVDTANLKVGEMALEVGPGEGFLTEALLATGSQVVAVEKDNRLIDFLAKKFAPAVKSKQLEIIHADILNFNFSLFTLNFKLIANIPYYLTGQILRRFLTAANQPLSMTLMLQKEVAERIVARNKKESLLSLSVKVYGDPRYVKTVPRGAFRPAPKVDSAIIQIDSIGRQRFKGFPLPKLARGTLDMKATEKKFFALLHRGFAAPRKMLRAKFGLTAAEFAHCGVDPTVRAENLTLDQWFCLAKQNSLTARVGEK